MLKWHKKTAIFLQNRWMSWCYTDAAATDSIFSQFSSPRQLESILEVSERNINCPLFPRTQTLCLFPGLIFLQCPTAQHQSTGLSLILTRNLVSWLQSISQLCLPRFLNSSWSPRLPYNVTLTNCILRGQVHWNSSSNCLCPTSYREILKLLKALNVEPVDAFNRTQAKRRNTKES